jgi:hypothetical protein
VKPSGPLGSSRSTLVFIMFLAMDPRLSRTTSGYIGKQHCRNCVAAFIGVLVIVLVSLVQSY